jgi:hypothetical protein
MKLLYRFRACPIWSVVLVVAAVVAAGGDLCAQPAPSWSFSASAATYVLPDSTYVQPSFNADRDWLHLEARYNYESLHTGSLWFGYNFSGGKTLQWDFTPLIGGVFGDTKGVAPGFKGALAWWKLEFYTENEYVADVASHSDSFFYDWSELSFYPVDPFRLGLVTQRTRAYESDRDIQRGLLVGGSFRWLNLTGYVFNPDDEDPSFVFSAEVTF